MPFSSAQKLLLALPWIALILGPVATSAVAEG